MIPAGLRIALRFPHLPEDLLQAALARLGRIRAEAVEDGAIADLTWPAATRRWNVVVGSSCAGTK